jgi:hypothetical protein
VQEQQQAELLQCRSAYTRNEMASAERVEEKRVMMSRG